MENPNTLAAAPSRPDYGEMSLADIVDGLLRGRRTIFTCIALGVAVASVLLFVQRSYVAEAQFLPPSAADIEPLNIMSARFVQAQQSLSALLGTEERELPLQLDGTRSNRFASFSPSQVYNQFLLRIQSRSLHRRVLEELNVLAVVGPETSAEQRATVDEAFQEWESGFLLTLDPIEGEDQGFARVSQEGADSAQIATFLNRAAEIAAGQVLDNLKRVVSTRISTRRAEIEILLANKRARAKFTRMDEIARMEEEQAVQAGLLRSLIETRQRLMENRNADQIARLKEALAIAEAAGLEEPLPGLAGASNSVSLGAAFGDLGHTSLSAAPPYAPRVEINDPPLFFRGAKMLRAELKAIPGRSSSEAFVKDLRLLEEQLQQVETNPQLEALRKRTNDDAFIVGLRELEIEDQTLAAIQLPEEGLAVMTFDQRALPPRAVQGIWSYLLPGILLGAALGVILALLQRVLRLQRSGRSSI